MRIALAGNPNSGKTTMFNHLTGSTQYVGNWPGVTVEQKSGTLKGNKDVQIMDLPGIYSLSPYTPEEVVSRDFLVGEKPSAIINIVDASNLERNLYLTTQLLEIGVPTVLALNMMDIVQRNKERIDILKLSQALGCEIIETTALRGKGSEQVAQRAIAAAQAGKAPAPKFTYSLKVERALDEITALLPQGLKASNRYYAIKLFERDEKILKALSLSSGILAQIERIAAQVEQAMGDDAQSIITAERYAAIGGIVQRCVIRSRKGLTPSDKIDLVLTNRFLGLPLFALVMYGVYALAMMGPGQIATDWVNDVLFGEWVPNAVSNFLVSINCVQWLQDLVLDGIIAGVGAVLGFVPQILVLFFALSILEDCGYMARVAFILDRIFRRFGLSGKSFIPMLIATGCGVPGIMATRTIENENDRTMTVMMATFIPCSAKLPIFGLFAGAIFGGSANIAFSMYLIGMATVVICGMLLKRTKRFKGDLSPFIMELPIYHVPNAKGVLIHTWERGWSFIRKAFTIILLTTVVIWFLGSYNLRFERVEADASILASLGRLIAPLFVPLGWGNWRDAVATLTGLIAKENIVSTFGSLYGMAELSEDANELWSAIRTAFTPVTAYSFMVFNLLCCPCAAAVGAIKREMGSIKKTLKVIGFQCLVAYIAALAVNLIGGLFI